MFDYYLHSVSWGGNIRFCTAVHGLLLAASYNLWWINPFKSLATLKTADFTSIPSGTLASLLSSSWDSLELRWSLYILKSMEKLSTLQVDLLSGFSHDLEAESKDSIHTYPVLRGWICYFFHSSVEAGPTSNLPFWLSNSTTGASIYISVAHGQKKETHSLLHVEGEDRVFFHKSFPFSINQTVLLFNHGKQNQKHSPAEGPETKACILP